AGSEQVGGDETAGTVERGLPEGQQPGIAEQQVEAQPEQAPDQHAAEQVGTGAENWCDKRRHDQDECCDKQYAVALPQGTASRVQVRRCGRLRTLDDGFVGLTHALPSTPMRPWGRTIRINAIAANSMTSEYTGLNRDVRLRICPAINPPRTAPGRGATARSTTTANDWMSTPKPMSGTIGTMGPSIMPAEPAVAAPIPQPNRRERWTLLPSRRTMRESSMPERMISPSL